MRCERQLTVLVRVIDTETQGKCTDTETPSCERPRKLGGLITVQMFGAERNRADSRRVDGKLVKCHLSDHIVGYDGHCVGSADCVEEVRAVSHPVPC